MAKDFQFPVWLIGTPEERAAEEERQRLARASFTRAKLTESERLVGRGRLLEITARQNLSRAGERDQLPKSQLAEALAMQGRYVEAAEAHPDQVRREHFERIVRALEMDDQEKCNCSDDETMMNGVHLAITPRFEERKIFSPVHSDIVSVITCRKCGHTNARKARSRLLPQQAALAQSEVAKKPIVNDSQLASLHASS